MLSMYRCDRIRSDPREMLWHFACGRYPNFHPDDMSRIIWLKDTHRGIQRLDRIQFPRKQKRYILSPKFEFRVNTAFERVVRCCAEHRPAEAYTWITPELIEAYVALHRSGHAHSFEAWENGALAGGCFGVQIGGYISVESMFHDVSNASKAAYGRSLLLLRDRGFELVDTCGVAEHMVNYGEEWVPQWRFDEMLRRLIRQPLTIADGRKPPMLPWSLLAGLEVRRLARAAMRRLRPGRRSRAAQPEWARA